MKREDVDWGSKLCCLQELNEEGGCRLGLQFLLSLELGNNEEGGCRMGLQSLLSPGTWTMKREDVDWGSNLCCLRELGDSEEGGYRLELQSLLSLGTWGQ